MYTVKHPYNTAIVLSSISTILIVSLPLCIVKHPYNTAIVLSSISTILIVSLPSCIVKHPYNTAIVLSSISTILIVSLPICIQSNILITRPLFTLEHSKGHSLSHWGRYKMAAVSQTTLWSAFSWMKMSAFLLRFYRRLFLRVQLTIFQH